MGALSWAAWEKQLVRLGIRAAFDRQCDCAVSSCGTCDEARMHLASSTGGKFDIVLAEVKLLALTPL